MKKRIVLSPLLLVVALACAREETTYTDTAATDTTLISPAGTAPPAAESALPATDVEFVNKAAKIGMTEVQLATNVSTRAQSQDVKNFAQRMITDHNASNQELMSIVAAKNVDPPANIDPDKQQLDAELAKLKGRQLDRRYMQAMVQDHAAAIKEFETAVAQLTDPQVRAWAEKSLPALREHHQMAQDILKKVR
jgi:putative membrane protein